MSLSSKHQPFLSAYEEINKSHKRFKILINKTDLTHTEKNLLKGLLLFKKDQIESAIEIIKRTQPQNKFILAYKHLFLGIIYNNICYYEAASVNLVESMNLFKDINEPDFLYKPIFIASNLYFNLKDLTRLKKYHNEFLKVKEDIEKHNILDSNYKLFINILEKNYNDGIEQINHVKESYEEHYVKDIKFYLVLKFTLNIQQEYYDEAYEVLAEYKKAGGYKIKSNYKFMLTLLNYITKNSAVYCYHRDFVNNHYLWQQLKIIQSLHLNNLKEAQNYWDDLIKTNPDLYGEDFEYQSDDLFKIALTKALNSVDMTLDQACTTTFNLDIYSNNNDKLKAIFDQIDHYITKDELISLLWQESWSPKNDGRLRTLISRVQKKYNIKIVNKDGKYKKTA